MELSQIGFTRRLICKFFAGVFLFLFFSGCTKLKSTFRPVPPQETEAAAETRQADRDAAETPQRAQAELTGQQSEQNEKAAAAPEKKTETTGRMSDKDMKEMIKYNVYAMEEAYQEGAYERAKREMDAVLNMMGTQFSSDAEKIHFIDRNFRPGQRELTFAIIMQDLGYRQPAPPVESDQTQIIQNSLAAERSAENAANVSTNSTSSTAPTGAGVAAAGASQSVNLPPPPPPETEATLTYRDMEKLDDAVFAADSSQENYFDPELRRFIQQEIRQVAIQMGEPPNFVLPEDFVNEIEFFIRRFQTKGYYREFFEDALRRSRKYIPALRNSFIEKGFPEEIMYLAFIESGFNPVAVSKSKATGMFQFMEPTAKEYGLKISRYTDERYSPIKSAVACREYLHDLQLELGSFTLALSSYNSGSGKTRRALKQLEDFKDRSFWALREQTDVLHQETRRFVPQIFAIIVMAKPGHPQKFGIQDVPFPDPRSYRTVIVPRQMPLVDLANESGISVAELIRLNPDLKPNAVYTPSKVLDYPIFVPLPKVETVARAVDTEMTQRVQAQPQAVRSTDQLPPDNAIYHRIKMGDNLYNLASAYSVSLEELMDWNNLSSSNITAGEYLVIYPKRIPIDGDVRGAEPRTVSNTSQEFPVQGMEDFQNNPSGQAAPTSNSGDSYSQTVSGDTAKTLGDMIVDGISEHLDALTAPSTEQQNNTNAQEVQRNSVDSPIVASSTAAATEGGETVEADGIYEIIDEVPEAPDAAVMARNYDDYLVDEQSIAAGETFNYRVAKGNTLSSIADFFEVSVSDIKRWNGLRSGTIQVNKKLKIVAPQYMKFFKYRVQNGDNLADIALHFDASVHGIRLTNGKSGNALKEGEILSIFGI